jgi:hypothetical protein
MRLAVMQPYVFPYLGYYQLVRSVDTFVFFDDVNFIVKGWINRNNILLQNQAHKFTIPLSKASQNRKINEIEISEYPKWRTDFLKLIAQSYKKAPHFTFFYGWLEKFLSEKEYRLIGELAADSVRGIATLLDLRTEFIRSSDLDYNRADANDGQEKILDICSILKASTYINPQSAEGLGLYDKDRFSKAGLELFFIKMRAIEYPQFPKGTFVPYLSMLDVMMFNDPEQTRDLLDRYDF